jgi:TRAP-type mannitol/chloroaromatic compound transport system permease large subunit
MKGIVQDTSMGDIYRAAVPFFLIGLAGLIIMVLFPAVVLWLPGLMK